MNKGRSSDKNQDPKAPTRSLKQIKFHLSDFNLACFKSNNVSPMPKSKTDSLRDYKWVTQQKTLEIKQHNLNPAPEKKRTLSTNSFTEKVVIMQYDNFDVYIDNSTRKKSNSNQSHDSGSMSKKSESQSGSQDEFVQSCVRVITEETDHTSHQMSMSNYQMTSPYLTPRSFQYDPSQSYYLYDYQQKVQSIRNKRSVTNEESKAYMIEYDNIEREGRTTIMIKNIPNKYTQEMLLEEFQDNYENKFDFFYLPIDKDNDCNVGYAFVNFINCSDLKSFYKDFHQKKWKKYKSPKICNICYARYQGTLQLADHFKHTKIMNQKSRKGKPLIGITEANKNKVEEIIKNQRNHQ